MDTAGQERFRAINTSYYRRADCCLLVYDISERASFDDLKNYFIKKIKEKCKKDIQIILLGNKADLENKRKVPSEEGAKLALENNYIFLETSCLKNSNVADAFETLIEITNREIRANRNQNKDSEKSNNVKISVKDQINPQKSSCSC